MSVSSVLDSVSKYGYIFWLIPNNPHFGAGEGETPNYVKKYFNYPYTMS